MRTQLLSLIMTVCAAMVANAQTVDHPYQVGGSVLPPVLVHVVRPHAVAPDPFLKPLTGTVTTCGVVDQQGVPQKFNVFKSSDNALNASALDAVRQYRYRAATLKGQPVAVRVCVKINFNSQNP
jgi:TonB family protein